MSLLAGASLHEFDDDTYRNIVSLRVSEDLFDDLSPDPQAQGIAIEHERRTKPPGYQAGCPIIDRPFQEAQWMDAIGFPFTRWSASRYSDGTFGVWYGAGTLDCTIRETVWHWRGGLLADAGFDASGVSQQRRVDLVRLDAALVDLRALASTHPELIDPHSYSATQPLGADLHRQGHPGLVARSARGAGDVFAILNPAVLSAPRQHCDLTYRIVADGRVAVERTAGRTQWLL